jgi:hypothetical protein
MDAIVIMFVVVWFYIVIRKVVGPPGVAKR